MGRSVPTSYLENLELTGQLFRLVVEMVPWLRSYVASLRIKGRHLSDWSCYQQSEELRGPTYCPFPG